MATEVEVCADRCALKDCGGGSCGSDGRRAAFRAVISGEQDTRRALSGEVRPARSKAVSPVVSSPAPLSPHPDVHIQIAWRDCNNDRDRREKSDFREGAGLMQAWISPVSEATESLSGRQEPEKRAIPPWLGDALAVVLILGAVLAVHLIVPGPVPSGPDGGNWLAMARETLGDRRHGGRRNLSPGFPRPPGGAPGSTRTDWCHHHSRAHEHGGFVDRGLHMWPANGPVVRTYLRGRRRRKWGPAGGLFMGGLPANSRLRSRVDVCLCVDTTPANPATRPSW